jgi:hypothetical protein
VASPRLSLSSASVEVPAWLHKGATVYDDRIRAWGEVQALGFPEGDQRQAERAWLRPVGGGREWNPLIEDLRESDDT